MPGVIERGTKQPTEPKHVEVASEGEQNNEDDNENDRLSLSDHFLICGAMGHQTPKGILSGPSALQQ